MRIPRYDALQRGGRIQIVTDDDALGSRELSTEVRPVQLDERALGRGRLGLVDGESALAGALGRHLARSTSQGDGARIAVGSAAVTETDTMKRRDAWTRRRAAQQSVNLSDTFDPSPRPAL